MAGHGAPEYTIPLRCDCCDVEKGLVPLLMRLVQTVPQKIWWLVVNGLYREDGGNDFWDKMAPHVRPQP
jgi:hypothetical protein